MTAKMSILTLVQFSSYSNHLVATGL